MQARHPGLDFKLAPPLLAVITRSPRIFPSLTFPGCKMGMARGAVSVAGVRVTGGPRAQRSSAPGWPAGRSVNTAKHGWLPVGQLGPRLDLKTWLGRLTPWRLHR